MNKEELTEAMREVLHEHRQIDDERHALHHEFLEMEIEKRERRKALFLRFKNSFVGGLALAILGFLGWIGKLVIDALTSGHHP